MATSMDRGRPGADDDDFEVTLEDDTSGGYNFDGDDDEVEEDDDLSPLESDTLPEGVEEGEEEPARGAGSQADAEEDDDDVVTRARIAADEANAKALSIQSDSIMREAESNWRITQAELNRADMALNTLAVNIEQATNALAQARDSGDTRTEIEIQNKLNEMHSLKGQIEAAKAQAPTRDQIVGRAQQEVRKLQSEAGKGRGTKIGNDIVVTNPMAERWTKQNAWMKANKEAARYVVQQSKSMAKEGWDANTPGFYAELGRRAERAFPGVKAAPLMAKQKAPVRNAKSKSAVAPSRSSMSTGAPARKQTSGRTYQITIQDQSAMRRMNLDPSNERHRKEFARSRIETANRGRQF